MQISDDKMELPCLAGSSEELSTRSSRKESFSAVPPVLDVMKDLRVDITLGRLRCTRVQQGRLSQGVQRAQRLKDLPAMVRSNIYPMLDWIVSPHRWRLHQGLGETWLFEYGVKAAS